MLGEDSTMVRAAVKVKLLFRRGREWLLVRARRAGGSLVPVVFTGS
jgi:hypothetical protein